MTLTKITLTVLIALLCSSSAQVSLERIIPEPGDPLCPGDEVKYNCVVKATQLIWTYTSDSGGTMSHDYFYTDTVKGNPAILGPFELVLESVDPSDSQFIINSTATTANGLAATENGKVITCLGTTSQPVTISFTVPTITNSSVCLDTIYWIPPLCEANCTVSVNGQDIDTVPCSNGYLSVSDSDLSNKTVVITTTDQLGNNLAENVKEDCKEMSTTRVSATDDMTIVELPPTSSNIAITESPAASITTAGIIGVAVAVIVAVTVCVVVTVIVLIHFRYRKNSPSCEPLLQHENNDEGQLHHSEPFDVNLQATYTEHEHPITHCAVSPDAMYVVTADTNMVLRMWKTGSDKSSIVDITKANLIAKPKSATDSSTSSKPCLPECSEWLVSLTWVNKSNERQLMLAYPNSVLIWDMSNSNVYAVFETQLFKTVTLKNIVTDQKLRIFCAACSSDSKFAVSFTKHFEEKSIVGDILLGDTNYSPHQEYQYLDNKVVPVVSMSFSPRGKQLVTGNIYGEICVYDCKNPIQAPCVRKAHDLMVYDVQFGATDETKVYTIGEDRKFCLLDNSMDSAPIKIAEPENVFCCEPSYSINESKEPTTFRYLCRNKLFVVGFANKYVLIGSPEGGIVYKIDSGFKLTKVQVLCSGGAVTCVDWVTCNDEMGTCVMGFADKSVKVLQLKKNFETESSEIASDHWNEGHMKTQQCTGAVRASLAASENLQNMNIKETRPPAREDKQNTEVVKSFLPNGKDQEGLESGTTPSSTSDGRQSDGARSAKPRVPGSLPKGSQQSTGTGNESSLQLQQNDEKAGKQSLPTEEGQHVAGVKCESHEETEV